MVDILIHLDHPDFVQVGCKDQAALGTVQNPCDALALCAHLIPHFQCQLRRTSRT